MTIWQQDSKVQHGWCQNWPFDKISRQFHVPHIPATFSPKISYNIILQCIPRNSQPMLHQNSLLFPCLPESNSALPLRVHHASSTVYHHYTAIFLAVLIPALKNTSCIRFSFWEVFVYNRRPSFKTIKTDKTITITICNPFAVQINVKEQIFTAKCLANVRLLPLINRFLLFIYLHFYTYTTSHHPLVKNVPTGTGLSRTIVLRM
jgi:hypothetical protein